LGREQWLNKPKKSPTNYPTGYRFCSHLWSKRSPQKRTGWQQAGSVGVERLPAKSMKAGKEIEGSRTPIYINNKCREIKHPVDVFSEGTFRFEL
jgi:hypothetical protein